MENETYALGALLTRMKYIARWGLMRQNRSESLSEHTAEAALLAHTLGLVTRDVLGDADVRPETLAVAALYHDASEILTGDMPTPVKYKSDELKTAYKALERQSVENLSQLAPAAIRPELRSLLTGDALSENEKVLLKAADRLSALIKCMEEKAGGNTEFESAQRQQLQALQDMNCPAANFFIEHYLPCYSQNLDELSRGAF
jgi:5'-deoxynucleotidase